MRTSKMSGSTLMAAASIMSSGMPEIEEIPFTPNPKSFKKSYATARTIRKSNPVRKRFSGSQEIARRKSQIERGIIQCVK